MNRAKIVDRYSVDVINLEEERAFVESRFSQSLSALKEIDPKSETYQRLCLDRDNALLELENYLLFEESEPPTVGDCDSLTPYYELVDNIVCQRWEVVNDDAQRINEKIAELKAQLTQSDYQIIKCYEASLLGEPLPYDAETISKTRQLARDEINALLSRLEPNPKESVTLSDTVTHYHTEKPNENL
ncbi:MAG: hypothetical protein SNG81_04380 [Rikenellaceae bacterium]